MKKFIFLMLFAVSAHAIEFSGVETTKMTTVQGFEDCTYNVIRIAGLLPNYVKVVKCPNASVITTLKKNKKTDDTTLYTEELPIKK